MLEGWVDDGICNTALSLWHCSFLGSLCRFLASLSDVCGTFEETAKTGIARTADKNMAPNLNGHEKAPLTVVVQPFFFFFFSLVHTNSWINWRAPSKTSFWESSPTANAEWAYKEVWGRKKNKSVHFVFVYRKNRDWEKRENDRQRGVKRALSLIIYKKYAPGQKQMWNANITEQRLLRSLRLEHQPAVRVH